MKKIAIIAACVTLCATCAPAAAVDAMYKKESANSADAVWAKIKGFCDITNALPALKCALSPDGEVRTLTTQDGKNIVEKREAFDEAGRTYSYAILDPGPLPVANYHSKIAIVANGSGSTIVWTGHFDAKGASDADAKKVMEGIYTAGADTLAK
jgi:hypothetical protein